MVVANRDRGDLDLDAMAETPFGGPWFTAGRDSRIDEGATVGVSDGDECVEPTSIGCRARIRRGAVIYCGVIVGDGFSCGARGVSRSPCMRVVAVFAMRNERPYLANCLDHLIANGLDYFVLDNESDDGSLELLREPRFAEHLVGRGSRPFTGVFDWLDVLGKLEATIADIDADWIVLHAPDEVMHSYTPGETLGDAIARIDAAGFDAIDFDEFVFLPVDHDYVPDQPGPQPLHWYYFFEPSRPRLMRARRRSLNVTWLPSGGHRLHGHAFKLAPETLALRHYMVRNQAHARAKYAGRRFPEAELAKGWHRQRAGQPADRFTFPPTTALSYLADPADRNLSRANPRSLNYWQW